MRRGRGPTQTGETVAAGEVCAGNAGRAAAFLQNELFVDLVACLLLATGLTLAIAAVTVLDSGLWKTLGLTSASLAVIAVMRIRWWLAPASAAAILAVTAAYHAAMRDMFEWAEYWTGLLRWALSGAPADRLYSESGGPLILESALAFATALAVFVLVRRLFVFPLALGLTSAVLILSYVLEKPDLSAALCFSAAGLIVLLPRVYAGYVRRNSDGAHSRGSMQSVAIPAALLALVLALVVVPVNTSGWRSRGLNNLAADIGQLLGDPFNAYPAYSSNFSMAMTGFQPDGSRMGGPVELGEARVALVTAEQPVLLRGSTLDHYTGESWWMGAPDGDFRFSSLFWRRYRRETYDLDKPAGSDAARLFDSLTRKTVLELNYMDDRFSTLFAAGRVRNIDIASRHTDMEPYFNARGELYLHVRIPQLTRVTVETTLWQPRTAGFDDAFLRLEQLTASVPDAQYDRLYERYTQLPDKLPVEVRETADIITAGLESPYEQARAIEVWLNENCTYTLSPESVPNGADFVAHFLETREGYCVYYASAMAVMARCAGLPSRYVTGFALERNPGITNGYEATEKTAHAWAEIYFRGIGWMEFDPLAWDAGNPLNSDTEAEQQSSSGSSTNALSDHIPESETHGDTFTPDDNAKPAVPAYAYTFFVLGAVLLCVLLRLAFRAVMSSKIRAFRLERALRRFPAPSSCIEYYYADILRQLSLLGLEPHPGETLGAFSARVDRRIVVEEGALAEIAEVRIRLHFAGIEPSPAEVEVAYRYHRHMELYLQERLGRTAYFFRRAVKQVKQNPTQR